MEFINHSSKVFLGKISRYIFLVEKLNSRHSFAFTSSNFIIDSNIRLLQSVLSKSLQNIDYNDPNKMHFLNFGKYIIILRYASDNCEREMYFIDYKLRESSILLMDEIFNKKEIEIILTLRSKMMETYLGSEEAIASIASIYN